jgi:hypothetical protein
MTPLGFSREGSPHTAWSRLRYCRHRHSLNFRPAAARSWRSAKSCDTSLIPSRDDRVKVQ